MTDNRTTELLREGLTERGVEWRSGLEGVTFVSDWCFVEYDNGKLAATCEPVLTPEQAIAATLGSGTCRNQWQWNSGFCCSECFCTVPFVDKFANSPFAYCPKCGKEVAR